MPIENDIIVWFDDKTGNELSKNDKNVMIEKMRDIANSYGLDFWMYGNPKAVKKVLDYIDFDYKDEESEVQN